MSSGKAPTDMPTAEKLQHSTVAGGHCQRQAALKDGMGRLTLADVMIVNMAPGFYLNRGPSMQSLHIQNITIYQRVLPVGVGGACAHGSYCAMFLMLHFKT